MYQGLKRTCFCFSHKIFCIAKLSLSPLFAKELHFFEKKLRVVIAGVYFFFLFFFILITFFACPLWTYYARIYTSICLSGLHLSDVM